MPVFNAPWSVEGVTLYFTVLPNMKNKFSDAIGNLTVGVASFLSIVHKDLQKLSSHLARQNGLSSNPGLDFSESGRHGKLPSVG